VNRVLQKAGYHTKLACDAAEALRLAEAFGPFDVLVTDLVMPQVSGDELARQLRAMRPICRSVRTGFSDQLFADRHFVEGEAYSTSRSRRSLLEALAQVRVTAAGVAAAAGAY
jgi:CheY-like chemotaxis protein